MRRIPYLLLIMMITLSCEFLNDNRKKVKLFNSKLSPNQALVINKLAQEMDNWFYEYSGGLDYNGEQMKSLLLEFSNYNNIGGAVRKSIVCKDSFSESEMDILFDIGSISLQMPTDHGTTHRGLLNKSNWLGKAICEYAIESQDSLLQNWYSNELEVIHVPGLICSDYGVLTSRQLEKPIIKRMLYMELILPEMLEYCYSERFPQINRISKKTP